MYIKEIVAEDAFRLLVEGALLVDVRETEEVLQTSFQVDETENRPYSSFDENYRNLPRDRNIIVACHLGIRSLRVAQFLLVQGWDASRVYSLEGGIDAWERAGLPVKSAPRSFSYTKARTDCGCGSEGCC